MKRVSNFAKGALGLAAFVAFVLMLSWLFGTIAQERQKVQPTATLPEAGVVQAATPTPVPCIKNARMSDAPYGAAVTNFPSRVGLVYAVFEYEQMQDAPIRVRVYDGVGNILFEQTKRYSGSGVESIAIASKAGVLRDGFYLTNIYTWMADPTFWPDLFLSESLEWAVGEELPTPTATPIPTPTVVLPTPAMPATPVAMETYISKTLITAKVGDGPGEIGIFLPPEGRPVVPTAIALDGKGNIYIFDAVNRRVMKYDSEGKFVSNIVPNPPMYGSVKDMCIGDNGAIYLLDGGGLFVRQYNQDGELVLEYPKPDWVEYFRSISLDNEGNLRAQVAELDLSIQDVRAILGNVRKIVAVLGNSREVFSREQQLRASRPGILLGGDTWIGGYGRSEDGKEMLIFDERGAVVLRLPILDIGAVTLDAFADADGNLYFVMSILRLSETPDKMYKFDPRGNLLAYFPVPAPYYAYPERRFVIDDAGSIYQLLPLRDEVQVIKWERP